MSHFLNHKLFHVFFLTISLEEYENPTDKNPTDKNLPSDLYRPRLNNFEELEIEL